MKRKKIAYKRFAFAASLIIMLIWGLLGTGTTLAWFNDSSDRVNNIFHAAEFKLKVSYKDSSGGYTEVTEQTEVFNENDIYEPGFTKVIYLKIKNEGSVPFEFSSAVSVFDYRPAPNAFGGSILLQDHLLFGVITSENEADLLQLPRESVQNSATHPLGNYFPTKTTLEAGEEIYAALTVYMPKETNNTANYIGNDPPTVTLGIVVRATQLGITE